MPRKTRAKTAQTIAYFENNMCTKTFANCQDGCICQYSCRLLIQLQKVSDGVKKVSDGVRQVSDGVRKVSDGVRKVSYGVREVSEVARRL